MKTKPFISVAVLLGMALAGRAQTADDYVAWGRANLSLSDLAGANACFATALVLDPNNPTANAFYSATRLLVLPNQRAGSEFLTRLGVSEAGRNLYEWRATFPTDRNGLPVVPVGLNASEFSAFIRTNLLPAIQGAETNLENISDTNFILALTRNETRAADVTVDYGDIQMLRAMLYAAEYLAYTACSWNVDSRLDLIRSLYTSDQLTLEGVLMDHPQLLCFASTNDLNAAKVAFQNAVDRYLAASDWIRHRPGGIVRLFNYDSVRAVEEENFRTTLIDLRNSLAGAVPLSLDTKYTVFWGAQFSGTQPPREFLPRILGNSFVLGTLPDPSFGELIRGLPASAVESFLCKRLDAIPSIAPDFDRTGGQFSFPLCLLAGRGYVVQVSTNLMSWTDAAGFVGAPDQQWYMDPEAASLPQRFYRLVDRTDDMPPPANDNFADRVVITGMGSTVYGYTAHASVEANEPNYGGGTVWWSWTAPISGTVVLLLQGSQGYAYAQIYTGDSLSNLDFIASNDQWFEAVAGTTYQIQVTGDWEPLGVVSLAITAPPVLTVFSPAYGQVLNGPTNVVINVSATDPDGTIAGLSIYGDDNLLGHAKQGSLVLTWTNVGYGSHDIDVIARDNLGATAESYLSIRVAPSNDYFTNRIAIVGGSAIVTGTTLGATKEFLEPSHAGYSGGSSVWWSWTAPSSGNVSLTVATLDEYWDDWDEQWYWYSFGYPTVQVYTGNSMSSLVAVAGGAASYYGDTARTNFAATAGTTYQIAVDGRSWYYQGKVGLLLEAFPPANDNFANRIPLSGASVVTNVCNFYSTREEGEPFHAGQYGEQSVWWSWVAPSNGPAVITASLAYGYWTTGEPLLGVYTGSVVSNLTAVAGNAASSYGDAAQVEFNATAGATYQIAVDERYGESGNVVLRVGPEPETPLALNLAQNDLSGDAGSRTYFELAVPPGLASLQISTFGGAGDCDLYVRFGAQPTLSSWDYRPYMDGNYETVTIPNPPAGDWHIMLHGYSGYSGVTLLAR